jgi:hypothetical protein
MSTRCHPHVYTFVLRLEVLAGGYYHWQGSLTTPPCSEGVDWNLMKMRLPVCERQAASIPFPNPNA